MALKAAEIDHAVVGGNAVILWVETVDASATRNTPNVDLLIERTDLVQTKLTAHRIVDSVHLRDMLDVELIDASWIDRYPPELGTRLQGLIDTPDG